MNLNKVFIIGNLTADPEVRHTQSGQMVCNLTIATNRTWKGQSGDKQVQTEFHNIVAWGRLAEIISNYLKKGSMALVEGRLATRSWEDKNGNKRYTTEIIAEGLQMGPKNAGGTGATSSFSKPSTPFSKPVKSEEKEEEIPIIQEGEEEIDLSDIPL
jgi:single-strand DNA-binding protein